MKRLKDDQDGWRERADCEHYSNQDENPEGFPDEQQNLHASGAGGGLDSSVDIVVSDEVSDQFYHEGEGVSSCSHSQAVARGPLLGVTRHEENSHAEDYRGDYHAKESL